MSKDNKSIFKVINGQTPTLLNEVIKKNIDIKTLYILNDIIGFLQNGLTKLLTIN